jgi:uncharacterized damage-inducible protein DinB
VWDGVLALESGMDDLLDLLSYQRWATERTLDAAAKLTAEQFTQAITSSFPGVRDTLVHTFGADRVWLGRISNEAPDRANPADFPTPESLREPWLAVLDAWTQRVSEIGDPKTLISYRAFNGDPFTSSLEEILRHVVNHGTYHRGQVTTMLRQLGAETVSTDLIGYYRQKTR